MKADKSYLQTNARKLDLALYEHLFEGADSQPVLDELTAYQNTDGGFGKSLEPDLRLPDSSVLATVVAFQYLSQLDLDVNNDLVKDAIRYLIGTYGSAKNGWTNIPPEADNYPRAPWWNYKSTLEWAGWGNPSAEVLGYLLKHRELVDDDEFLQKISKQAVQRLQEIDGPEEHEIKCYVRLYENASQELQAELYELLAKHIKQASKTDSKDWGGYVATPLTFVDSPNSSFAKLFDRQLLIKNIQHLKGQVIEDTHWEPTWNWGQYEEEWTKAKAEWSGKLTKACIMVCWRRYSPSS